MNPNAMEMFRIRCSRRPSMLVAPNFKEYEHGQIIHPKNWISTSTRPVCARFVSV